MFFLETKQQRYFIKQGIVADPDWSALPEEPPADRRCENRWRLATAGGDLQAHAAMFFVTFRRADGTEVLGATCKADVLWRSGADISAAAEGHSSSWKLIGRLDDAQSTAEGFRFDVGGDGIFALRLYDITAAGAVAAYVTAQQWGVG
jgi:hypothetical protein